MEESNKTSRTWSILIVLILAAVLATGCGNQSTPQPTVAATQSSEISPPTDSAAPAPTTESFVTTGLTDDGHHYWGAPDAPVTMIDYSDFM